MSGSDKQRSHSSGVSSYEEDENSVPIAGDRHSIWENRIPSLPSPSTNFEESSSLSLEDEEISPKRKSEDVDTKCIQRIKKIKLSSSNAKLEERPSTSNAKASSGKKMRFYKRKTISSSSSEDEEKIKMPKKKIYIKKIYSRVGASSSDSEGNEDADDEASEEEKKKENNN